MTTKDEPTGTDIVKGAFGCLAIVWHLLITAPMWLVLMFGILQALGDATTQWMWVLYWVYVPCAVLGTLFASTFKAASQAK